MPSDHIARTRAAREITRESRLREAIDAANIGETNRRILRMRYIDGRCFAYIITDTIKNIDKIEMLEDSGEYSRGGGRPIMYDSRDSYGPRAGTHYVDGYYRRDDGDGYTRDDGRDAMKRRIHEMMDGASEKDREALRRCLDAMS